MKPPEQRLFAFLLVVLLGGVEALLANNVLYTEGEVVQVLYGLLVLINIPILFLAVFKPRYGMWAGVGLGMLLLPWQAVQNMRLVQLHEEVVAVVQYIEIEKTSTGKYPTNVKGHVFLHGWTKKNMSYRVSEGAYRIDYFLNNSGTGYWYTPKGGYEYYPD